MAEKAIAGFFKRKEKYMKLTAQEDWIKEQLTLPYTAYNVGFSYSNEKEDEIQGNYMDDPDDFVSWLEEVLDEIVSDADGATFSKIEYIEADHRLAQEVKEDKTPGAADMPGWGELEPVTIYIPSKDQIIRITEGSWDENNLSEEDMDKGFVDYLNYSQRALSDLSEECNRGKINKTQNVRDIYPDLKKAIPEVLESAYGNATLPYMLLEAVKRNIKG